MTQGFTAGLLLLSLMTYPVVSFGVAGYESLDRPSEWRPGLPYFKPKDQPLKDFELPKPSTEPSVPEGESRKIKVSAFRFEGNTIIASEVIQALIDRFTQDHVKDGKSSVDQIEILRREITQVYIDQGYINSGARIEAYDPSTGQVSIKIVEGRITDFVIRGLEGLSADYIRSRLETAPDEPFNIQQLQANFQLLLNDPLLEGMKGKIRPGDEPGEAIIDVEVQRARAYGLTTFVDNYRPPTIGAIGAGGSGWVRNMTGLGDALQMTVGGSGGSMRYSGGYSIPLFGTRALGYINFDEGNSQVIESSFQNLNILSYVHIGEIGVSYPLIEDLKRRLVIGSLFSVRANETSLLGRPYSFVPGVTGGYTQVTVARTYQDYNERWNKHALSLRNTLSFGMDALGATAAKMNYPSSQFVSWLFQSQYAYLLNEEGAQFIFRQNLQLTNHPLLPLERMAVGGISTVRGYRTNFLVRDDGYTLSGEVRYPFESLNLMGYPLFFTLVPFTDFGSAWNLGGPRGNLCSVGAAINLKYQAIQGDLTYGYALKRLSHDPIRDVQDEGIFFRIAYDVL
jgi:hemolysin activation/secretion protein